jgi:hypothetical protein
MLAKYPHLVLFPVHPTTAARYRETFCPSGAKADPSDTASLLDLLLRHRERLHQLRPDTVETRLLQFLVEERRRTVDERTRHSNRLADCLKLYFPQVVQWFDDLTSPLVGDLLERWPGLEQLQRVHPGTLHKFFHEHNCRGEKRMEERIHAVYDSGLFLTFTDVLSLKVEFLRVPNSGPSARLGFRSLHGYRGGHTILREYVHTARPQLKSSRAFLRMEPPPGERFEVDWGHFGVLDYFGDKRKLYTFALSSGA